MMLVTIHLQPGQTDRDLQRELLALDPSAQIRRVTGRNGRTGVLVDGDLALRYLLQAFNLDRLAPEGLVALPVETVGRDAGATILGVESTAVTESGLSQPAPVADQPPAKPKPPAKKAAKKAAPAAGTDEEV